MLPQCAIIQQMMRCCIFKGNCQLVELKGFDGIIICNGWLISKRNGPIHCKWKSFFKSLLRWRKKKIGDLRSEYGGGAGQRRPTINTFGTLTMDRRIYSIILRLFNPSCCVAIIIIIFCVTQTAYADLLHHQPSANNSTWTFVFWRRLIPGPHPPVCYFISTGGGGSRWWLSDKRIKCHS